MCSQTLARLLTSSDCIVPAPAQFWSLYLREVFDLDPIKTQWLMLEVMIGGVVGMPLAYLLARFVGHQVTIVLFRCLGVWGMWQISQIDPEVDTLRALQFNMTLRLIGMMSVGPLIMSTFTDILPTELRTRYMGIASCLGIIATASTIIGGQLINDHGYGYTFKVTAITCGIDVAIHALLVPFLPRFETRAQAPARPTSQANELKQKEEEQTKKSMV